MQRVNLRKGAQEGQENYACSGVLVLGNNLSGKSFACHPPSTLMDGGQPLPEGRLTKRNL